MKLFLFALLVIASQSFGAYSIGDTITIEHQNMKFPYCYGDIEKKFSFSGMLDKGFEKQRRSNEKIKEEMKK